MRCKNCGWENPDNNSHCEKCNTPLHESEASSTPAESPWGKALEQSASSLNKTVCEGAFFPPEQAESARKVQQIPEDGGTCPSCGYPLRPGVHVCPNCNYGLNISQAQEKPQTQPAQQQSGISGTVNPWINIDNSDMPSCSLTPIKHGSETQSPQPKHFNGEINELNRSCLDAENMTITSNVQARLTFEDGKWFIEDASSQQTTYIHVGKKTELKNGDIILMGNRQFIFNE